MTHDIVFSFVSLGALHLVRRSARSESAYRDSQLRTGTSFARMLQLAAQKLAPPDQPCACVCVCVCACVCVCVCVRSCRTRRRDSALPVSVLLTNATVTYLKARSPVRAPFVSRITVSADCKPSVLRHNAEMSGCLRHHRLVCAHSRGSRNDHKGKYDKLLRKIPAPRPSSTIFCTLLQNMPVLAS